MKEPVKISKNSHYTAVNLGTLTSLMDYSQIHPVTQRVIKGKVFLKEVTHATGTQISFHKLPPHTPTDGTRFPFETNRK